VKKTKCAFGVESISYLGHIISAAGVAMDPAKVQAVVDCRSHGLLASFTVS
jgi:hypothetical protein